MTHKFDQILSESKFSDEDKALIQEAWENKMSEAKEIVASELREEFSARFEHDKSVLVESIDSFLSERVRAELAEFAEDRSKLIAERVQYKAKLKEHVKMLDKFVTESIVGEVKELRNDKVAMKEGVVKLENFVLKQLAEEIKDFRADKKALVEQRVKLVREGKAELQEAKKNFVKRAAALTETTINAALRSEISQLKEDITEARKNEFGREIFETFRSTYLTTHLNEASEVAVIKGELNKERSISEGLRKEVNVKQKLVESAKTQLSASRDLAKRKSTMTDILRPLSIDQRKVMSSLLESVQTDKLQGNFDKYLPTVINETATPVATKKVISESNTRVARTGNKKHGTAHDNTDVVDLAEMRRLAGI